MRSCQFVTKVKKNSTKAVGVKFSIAAMFIVGLDQV